MLAITDDARIAELHSVAGDTCILLKVRCEGTLALEQLLKRVYDTPGMRSTRSYSALNTYIARAPAPISPSTPICNAVPGLKYSLKMSAKPIINGAFRGPSNIWTSR